MRGELERGAYRFPHLVDEDQRVVRAYDAACTPDFFLYDRALRLAYRGQFDANRPGNSVPVTGDDLRAACEAVLRGEAPDGEQRPSLGATSSGKCDGNMGKNNARFSRAAPIPAQRGPYAYPSNHPGHDFLLQGLRMAHYETIRHTRRCFLTA